MYYAVRSVEDKEYNKIFDSWEICKPIVIGRRAVYKSFKQQKDAEEFLRTAPVLISEYGHGYQTLSENTRKFYGKYLFTRFECEANGLTIAVYETSKGARVSCKGYWLPKNKRLTYCFSGHFERSSKYGLQFITESYKEHITDTKKSIVGYLSSGIIEGVGEKTAERIYDMYRGDTIRILEEEPKKLLWVKGISKKKLDKIIESYNKAKSTREITMFLLEYGISATHAAKIHALYQEDAIKIIKTNPYLLCAFKGITFEDADNVAKGIGFDLSKRERIEAAVIHVISEHTKSGNTVMEQNLLGKELVKTLSPCSTDGNTLLSIVIDMIKNKQLRSITLKPVGREKSVYVTTPYLYNAEYMIASTVTGLLHSNQSNITEVSIRKLIAKGERELGIKLDDTQKKAVVDALLYRISIISGPPGTGKTSLTIILDYVYTRLYNKNKKIYLAPTGRASRKMAEALKQDASTIHSYLKLQDDSEKSDSSVEIKDSLVLVDEFSMADILVTSKLFSAIGENCTIVLVGDIEQLPSVGPGAVLRDLIKSNKIPVTMLEKVYRQDNDTQLYLNIKKMRKGDTDIKEAKDFHVYSCKSMEDVKNLLIERVVFYAKKYGIRNVMCLCPYKEHTAGVKDMNIALQDILNPAQNGKVELVANGELFREGDLVMNLSNNEFASNGDIGTIIRIDQATDERNSSIMVSINNSVVTYDKSSYESLTLAYATSVHKAQGGQAKAVVTTLMPFHQGMIYRAIPYVAISRGTENVDFCGDIDTLKKAILTPKDNTRITMVGYFMDLLNGEFVYV